MNKITSDKKSKYLIKIPIYSWVEIRIFLSLMTFENKIYAGLTQKYKLVFIRTQRYKFFQHTQTF